MYSESSPPAFDAPLGGFLSEYCHPVWCRKTRMVCIYLAVKKIEDIFIRFDTRHKRDTHTHTVTTWRHRPRLCIASRGKKSPIDINNLCFNVLSSVLVVCLLFTWCTHYTCSPTALFCDIICVASFALHIELFNCISFFMSISYFIYYFILFIPSAIQLQVCQINFCAVKMVLMSDRPYSVQDSRNSVSLSSRYCCRILVWTARSSIN